MICHYWYFKNIGFKFESYTRKGCHILSVKVYELDNVMILNMKGVGYRCFVFGISKYTTIKLLNNSQLDNKGTL